MTNLKERVAKIIIGLIILFLFIILFRYLFISREWYIDADNDGYGDKNVVIHEKKSGYVDNYKDIDDANPCTPDPTSSACVQLPKNPDDITEPAEDVSSSASESTTEVIKTPIVEPKTTVTPSVTTTSDKDDDDDGHIGKKDECPARKVITSKNGCPLVKIKNLSAIYKDQEVAVELDEFISLNGDNIKWSVAVGAGTFVNSNAIMTTLRMSKPGLHTIQVDVNGSSDGFTGSDSKQICVEYSKEELNKIIDKARILGNYDDGQFIPSNIKTEAEKALQTFIEISSSNIQISSYGTDIDSYIRAKIMELGSYVKSINVIPTYNKATCKVERITFNIK